MPEPPLGSPFKDAEVKLPAGSAWWSAPECTHPTYVSAPGSRDVSPPAPLQSLAQACMNTPSGVGR